MSALAQRAPLYSNPSHQLSELDATLEISRIAASNLDTIGHLDAIAGLVIKIGGVRQLELTGEPIALFISPLAWGQSKAGPHASALAEVTAHGLKWGELRLSFDPHSAAIESPLRLAKFVAQQTAAILNRAAFLEEQHSWHEQIDRLRRIIARRKAIHKAKAILSRAKRISERDALTLLCQYSRESGKTLHQVAEAFIFSDGEKWRPARRLTAVPTDAATTSNFAASTVRIASSR